MDDHLDDVIRRRRMTRNFDARPIPAALLGEILDLARRAPSAGFSQGTHFLVLEGQSLRHFWEATGSGEWFATRQPGLLSAPVVVIPLADAGAYTARYAEPDKAGHGLEAADNWPVPYWLTDTAMATQNLLLLAEARGLGALFFGVFRNAESFVRGVGVPDGIAPIGAVALGFRSDGERASGSPLKHPRRPASEVIHRHRW